MINIPAGLNYLKTNEDNLDVNKLKAVSIDLKKLSDVVNIYKLLKTQHLKTKYRSK